MVKDKDKDKKKHLDNGTEHLAWWGRERSAKRVTVSPAEAISGPLYKPPPCISLHIFVHLCTDRSLPHSQNILVNGQVAAAGQLGHLHLNHRQVWPT